MALVESLQHDDQLHGSIETIEDSSLIPSTKSQENDQEYLEARIFEQHKSVHKGSEHKKDDIILVTVKPLPASSSSSQDSIHKAIQEEITTSNEIDQDPAASLEARRRRYSVMMASLAAARVEESKAALRSSSRASPGDATGVPADTAIDGWKWQTRKDLEDDFSMREKYFADEL